MALEVCDSPSRSPVEESHDEDGPERFDLSNILADYFKDKLQKEQNHTSETGERDDGSAGNNSDDTEVPDEKSEGEIEDSSKEHKKSKKVKKAKKAKKKHKHKDKDKDKDRHHHHHHRSDSSKTRSKSHRSHRSRSRSAERRRHDERSHRERDRSRSPIDYIDSSRRSRGSPIPSSSRRDSGRFNKEALLEVAKKNVKLMIQSGTLPKGVNVDVDKLGLSTKEDTASSVDKFTEICRQIQEREDSIQDDDSSTTRPVLHPFIVKDRSIKLNLPNASQIPVKTFQEKMLDGSMLHSQFPVSSGSTHRKKELDWQPVEKTTPKEEPKAKEAKKTISLPETPTQVARPTMTVPPKTQLDHLEEELKAMTIPQVMTKRVEALQKLQKCPSDRQAKELYEITERVIREWSQGKQLPGQLTNSVDPSVRWLSPAELQQGPQAWVQKDQLQKARAVEGGIGMALLQKMGWTPGTALGKNREGALEPLLPPIKIDRKGLVAQEETVVKDISVTVTMPNKSVRATSQQQDIQQPALAGKHPVSALLEYCTAKNIPAPEFVELPAFGPDHKKTFMFKVIVDGKPYQPIERSTNKKLAKASAALVAINEMGILQGVEKGPRMSLMVRPSGNTDAEAPANEAPKDEARKARPTVDATQMTANFFTSLGGPSRGICIPPPLSMAPPPSSRMPPPRMVPPPPPMVPPVHPPAFPGQMYMPNFVAPAAPPPSAPYYGMEPPPMPQTAYDPRFFH